MKCSKENVLIKNLNVGDIIESRKFGKYVVIDIVNSGEVVIKFFNTGELTKVRAQQAKNGSVRDRKAPSVFGVGIIGDFPTNTTRQQSRAYRTWVKMLQRCYDERLRWKYPTYEGVTVSENFKDFSFFWSWCQKQVGYDTPKWCLDKDILSKGSKIYSENTCCFVPHCINTIFTETKKSNTSGHVGVSSLKNGKFSATLTMYGKQVLLGKYEDFETAKQQYLLAKSQHIKVVALEYKNVLPNITYAAILEQANRLVGA